MATYTQRSSFSPSGVEPPPPMLKATGISGRSYDLQLHPIRTDYLDRSGVYIFVKRAANGGWDAIYIGETGSFKRRLSDELTLHHQWQGIIAHGATHIGTLHVPRGGLDHFGLTSYFNWLKLRSDEGNNFLPLGNIVWETIDENLVFIFKHKERAGLQLADTVASAFFKACDYVDTGECDPEFAKLLAPRMCHDPDGSQRNSVRL